MAPKGKCSDAKNPDILKRSREVLLSGEKIKFNVLEMNENSYAKIYGKN